MSGTIQRNSANLHDQDTGELIGYINPITGREVLTTSGVNTEYQPADLDWLGLRSNANWTLAPIPTPYSPAHVLHPSVVYFAAGWRGYRYWMAYTPYPDSDPERENPCVAASNDGLTWVAMGAQPLVASPAGGAFNSDTDLAYDAAGDRLVLVFRDSQVPTADNTRLSVMTSSDGVTWSAPVVIYTSSGAGTAGATDILSPSLMWNGGTSRWEILGHRVRDAGSAWPVVKITSAGLTAGWDTTLTELTCDPPAGRKWWHSQIRRLSGGAYVGIAQDNNGTLGSTGNLYALYSSDGTTFGHRLIEDASASSNPAYYRPSFVIAQDATTREWVCQAFASRLTTSGVLAQTMRFDAAAEPLRAVAEIDSILNAGATGAASRVVLASDSFNRANDATGLGTASDSGTYTQPGGPTDVIGVSSNQAYNVTTGNCRAVRSVGRADYQARMTLALKQAPSGQAWLIVRWVDANNYLRAGISGPTDQLRFQRITGGGAAVNEVCGVTPLNGDEVVVRCAGPEIVVFLNGRRVYKTFQTQGLTTGLTCGVQMSGTVGGRLDNFAVTALA